MNLRYTDDQLLEALAANDNNKAHAANALGYDVRGFKRRIRQIEARAKQDNFSVEALPDTLRPVYDLVQERKHKFAQLHAAKTARKLIPVQIKLNGPIGIAHLGDNHIDDDGCDIALLERHAHIINQTPGLFGANVGDHTNNWVGRLARLYAEQSTSAKEAWQLAEWYLTQVNWLYIMSGNHDCWSGAGDPLPWILKQCGGVKEPMAARLNLRFPNGREVRINARHDFKGHSMWNTAHGPAKAAQMGWRDHILIAGHLHISGYNVLKDPMTGLISHAIRVASYKTHDRYAEELGLPDQTISPCVTTIIDPDARDEVGLVTVLQDPEAAADYLTWLRRKRGV